jgi:hypothetical protein
MKYLLIITLLFSLNAFAIPSISSSIKTVTTAGTAERLSATSSRHEMIVLQAECDNTGNIFIGGSTVDSSNGIQLAACETFVFSGNSFRGTIAPFDLRDIWIDVATNGEGAKILSITN